MFKIFFDKLKNIIKKYFSHEEKYSRYLTLCIFCLCLVLAVKYSFIGINNYLLDNHSFRQTQTALTAYYFVKDGFKFAYETPILGNPWTIPFEFPIYQWIVALIKILTNGNLDLIGRIVSLSFYSVMLFYLFKIIQKFTLRYDYSIWVIIFTMMHPIYIFWSRTFMIESTVLCFSVVYLFYSLQYFESFKIKYIILTSFFGVLAALTKITTFLPFMFFTLILAWTIWLREKGHMFRWKITLKYIALSISIFIIPFLSAKLWVDYSDNLKKGSNYAYNYTSSKNLMTWNFGTLKQRISFCQWEKILINSQIYSHKLYLLIISLIIFIFLKKLKFRYHVLICIGLYLLAPLIFTNLHIVHDYYTFSNSIFLCSALGFIIISFISTNLFSYKVFGIIIGIFFILFFNKKYKEGYYLAQNSRSNYLIPITNYIKKITSSEDQIIVYGNDWGSEYAYYSERKTLAITNIFKSVRNYDFIELMDQNDTSKIKTILFINTTDLYYNKKFAGELINYFGFKQILRKKPFVIYSKQL